MIPTKPVGAPTNDCSRSATVRVQPEWSDRLPSDRSAPPGSPSMVIVAPSDAAEDLYFVLPAAPPPVISLDYLYRRANSGFGLTFGLGRIFDGRGRSPNVRSNSRPTVRPRRPGVAPPASFISAEGPSGFCAKLPRSRFHCNPPPKRMRGSRQIQHLSAGPNGTDRKVAEGCGYRLT
jgi:hypothetical protein